MAARTSAATLAEILKTIAKQSSGSNRVSMTTSITPDGDVHVYSVFFPFYARVVNRTPADERRGVHHIAAKCWCDFLSALNYHSSRFPDVVVHVEVPLFIAREYKSSMGKFVRNRQSASSTGIQIPIGSARRCCPIFSTKELTLHGEVSQTQYDQETLRGKDRAYID